MGLIARFRALLRVMGRKKRPMETLRLLRQRPGILLGVNVFETGLLASGKTPMTAKALATVKTSSLVGCPF